MGCLKSKSKSKKIQTDAEAQAEALETPSVFERARPDFGQGEPTNLDQNADHKLAPCGWIWLSHSANDDSEKDKDKKAALKVKTKGNLVTFSSQKPPPDAPKTEHEHKHEHGHDFLWIDSHFEFGVTNRQHFWTIQFGDVDHEAGVGITRRNKLKQSGSNGIFFENGLILANSRVVVKDYGPKIRSHDKVDILLAFSHRHKENHEHDHDHEETEEKQELEKEQEQEDSTHGIGIRLRLYFFHNNISLGLACELEVPGHGQGHEFTFTSPSFGGFHPALRFFGHSGSASIVKEPLDHLPPPEQLLRFQEKGIVGEWRMNNHATFFSNKHHHKKMHHYQHPESDPIILVIERSSDEKTDYEYKMDIQFHRNSIGQTDHLKFRVKKLFMHSKWQGENWKNGDALRVKRRISFHHHHKNQKEKEAEADEPHVHRPSWEQEQFEAELTKLCHNPDTVECNGDVLEIEKEKGKTTAVFHRIHRHPKPFIGELPGEIPFQ